MRVLMVCTGNVCRSPVMAAAFHRALDGLDVHSAGTRVRGARPAHPWTVQAADDLGLDVSAHVSRHLDERVLAGADLVVTAERAHRSVVLGLAPRLLRRTVTLTELVGLAEAVGSRPWADGPAGGLLAAVAERGRHPVGADDLVDPITGGPADHAASVRAVVALVDRLTVSGGGHVRTSLQG